MKYFKKFLNLIKRYGPLLFIKVLYLNICRKYQFFLNLNFLELKSLTILRFIPNFIAPVFSININKIRRTVLSFSGSKPYKDPFVQLVKKIHKNETKKYQSSNLERYYESYKIDLIYDLFPLTLEYKNSKIFSLKARYINNILPWDEVFYKKTLQEIVEEIDKQKNILRKTQENNLKFNENIFYGNQNFGPVHMEMGKLEFERYKSVLSSIIAKGYKPDLKNNPHISGQILKDKDEWLTLISDGVHRSTVLIAINYIKLPISFKVIPKIIDRKEVSNWPGVTRHYYTVDEALIIFDSIFQSNNSLNIYE